VTAVSRPSRTGGPPDEGPTLQWLWPALLVAGIAGVAGWWASNTTGIVSSNDGSHVALARALSRGETRIDPDAALTLGVDLAKTERGLFSDRPPGTAMAAVVAVRAGAALDATLAQWSREAGELVAPPGSKPYILTYAGRFPGATPLVERIGTGSAAALHGVLMGLIGVIGLWWLLLAWGVERGARAFAVGTLALGSAYGPYATSLLSHVSAATWLVLAALGVTLASRSTGPATWKRPAIAAGAAASMAVACDYLLVLAAVPLIAVMLPRNQWRERVPWLLLGVVPIAGLVAAYHHAAFGSVFSIGYDHHANFAFARGRAQTFSGSAVDGLWTLVGWGEGGGLLALSPMLVLGGFATALPGPARRPAVALVPWVLALSLHATPAGGIGNDHRYLVPALPFLATGLAFAWTRMGTIGRGLLCVAAAAGGFRTWTHFWAWHEAPPLQTPGIGLCVALIVAAAAATWTVRAGRPPETFADNRGISP
jgi:hypothetical protein